MSFLDFFRSKASIRKRWTKKAKQFADYICRKYNFEEAGEASFDPAIPKWQFPLVQKVGDRETHFRLDLFRKNKKHATKIEHEPANEFDITVYDGIEPWLKYHGFLYECKETVEEYVNGKNFKGVHGRQTVVIPLLSNIVDDLLQLRKDNLYHSHLSFDSFNVDAYKSGRVGAWEHVVYYSDMLNKDVSNIQHLPPEALRREKHIARNIAAEEAWCLGDLLLNILLRKSISGPNFNLHTKPPSRHEAYNWIMDNRQKLRKLLAMSSLEVGVQTLILRLLDLNPLERLTLIGVKGILEELKRSDIDHIDPFRYGKRADSDSTATSFTFPWFEGGREPSPERPSSSLHQQSSRKSERASRLRDGDVLPRSSTIVRKTVHGDYEVGGLLQAVLNA